MYVREIKIFHFKNTPRKKKRLKIHCTLCIWDERKNKNLSGKKNREKVLFWHPCYENITPTGKYESKKKIFVIAFAFKIDFFCLCLIHSLAWFIDKNSFSSDAHECQGWQTWKHFFFKQPITSEEWRF